MTDCLSSPEFGAIMTAMALYPGDRFPALAIPLARLKATRNEMAKVKMQLVHEGSQFVVRPIR